MGALANELAIAIFESSHDSAVVATNSNGPHDHATDRSTAGLATADMANRRVMSAAADYCFVVRHVPTLEQTLRGVNNFVDPPWRF